MAEGPRTAAVLVLAAAALTACGEPPQERQDPVQGIERSLEAGEEIIPDPREEEPLIVDTTAGPYQGDTILPPVDTAG